MEKKKVSVGGQAVIEGVMMKGPEYLATAVRKSSGEIVYRKQKLKKPKFQINKIPFVRGTAVLVQSLVMGMKELSFSAKEAEQEEEEELTNFQMGMTLTLSMLIGIGIFIALPSFAGSVIGKVFFEQDKVMENILEGILRLIVFLGYIIGISFIPDIKRVFQYHGAEHKSIYTFEHDKDLTVENAKIYTTLHPRCGTSFLIIVMVISVVVFAIPDIFFIKEQTFVERIFVKIGLRVLLLPIVAGISYEFQRFTSKYIDNPFIKILAYPGLMLQKITTKEPDASQLEVSLVALRVSLGEKNIENATDISGKYFDNQKDIKIELADEKN